MNATMKMAHAADPAKVVRDSVGSLAGVEVFHNQILIGTYIRPEQTKGGVFLPGQTRAEDRWQGKVGLVLKKGPTAFCDDNAVSFAGVDVAVGDWVVFSQNDGWSLNINGAPCRMLQDVHIKARVAAPDMVY